MSAGSRCLIADSDVATREYLASVLARWGFGSVLSADGQDAAGWLGMETFDAAFISLHLPGLNGGHIAGLMHRGVLKKPPFVVLLGSAVELARIADLEWAKTTTLLAKPFGEPDLRGLLERGLGSRVSTVRRVLRRGVALVGRGFWSEAVAKVVTKRGAPALIVGDASEVPVIANARPAVVVVGPPLADPSIIALCSDLRRDPAFAGAAVVAVLNRADDELRADLLTLGVDRSIPVTAGMERVTAETLEIAGLATRRMPRVELSAAVRVTVNDRIELARAFDVGEGGIGLRVVTTAPHTDEAWVEFVLPGEDHVICADAEVAWSRVGDDERVQLGMRFRALENGDRNRIRNYVLTQALAA